MFVDFKCECCGNVFEERVQSPPPTFVCPRCGEEARRIFSAPRFNFQSWKERKMKLVADALGDDVDYKKLPSKPQKMI